ncbi:alpha/beta hydrolase-fold protein [Sphingobacterium oryzagri]|uniref:Alpha/beta hydrolase-fold protein n=1 Tax=Sphingobacterium oryzagri TaxID=3025669 RepID=A0ABY7WLK5_9SPHI|nr:alpha/beta hydrolase-fold protein [Sphingobacterium sp. KACC 22765]WDF70385.1 alpha/beta hydrolase-fold protein [Sphingobacterium sp. KACC 22765]
MFKPDISKSNVWILKLVLLLSLFSAYTFGQVPKDAMPAHATLTIDSHVLGEQRRINVWLPEEYPSGGDELPILYMADGGIAEDFPHLANTLADLIANQVIPPMMLVGIENIQRRKDLTGPTTVKEDLQIAPVVGHSALFRSFIATELMPEVEMRYRHNGKKGLIGESLAGLFVIETFLIEPQLFDYYIAFDPSLWWNKHHLLDQSTSYLAKFPQQEKKLWFASSHTEEIYGYSKQFAERLTRAKLPALDWVYCDEPAEQHHTIFRATEEKALRWMFEVK